MSEIKNLHQRETIPAKPHPPRFTLSVHMDGSADSLTLLKAVRKIVDDGQSASGPDLLILMPRQSSSDDHQSEVDEEGQIQAEYRCRTTFSALSDGIGCTIGWVFVKLPATGHLAQFHRQIVAGNTVPHDAPRPAAALQIVEKNGDGHDAKRNGNAANATPMGDREEILEEFQSRLARMEGVLVSRMLGRLDERLSKLATQDDIAQMATKDEMLQAVRETVDGTLAALIEKQETDGAMTAQQKDDAVARELRAQWGKTEAIMRENDELKAELARRRWWQLWK